MDLSFMLLLFLSSLGSLSLCQPFISILKWFHANFLRTPKNLKQYGSWALITGSTDGIGKAFAFELANKGLNLILVGRNMNKLKIVSSTIQSEYPNTHVKIVVVDFSNDDLTVGIQRVKEEIQGLDVGVLINNVGVTYPGAAYFHEVDTNVWMNLVRVNVGGTTMVTRVVAERMVERKRGAIVNIGSGAGIVVPSHPLYAIYAATKEYVDQFSRSMFVEYKDWGIDVQCQVPLYVATSMASRVAFIVKPSLFVPSPESYARAAVRRIGYEARCTPYWAHSLQWYFAHLLPDSVLDAWRLSIGISRMASNSRISNKLG